MDMPPYLINDYGYTYFMFCYGDYVAHNYKGERVPVPQKLLKGTGAFFNIEASKGNIWITFEIKNHVLHKITGVPSITSRNQLYNLEDYASSTTLENLYNDLKVVHEIEEIVDITDAHLSSYYKDWSKPLDSTPLVDFIYEKKGLLTLRELLDKYPYSERTLERLFKKEVGASPYRFICLVRFNYVIREIECNPDIAISNLIAQYDYYDHSHFEKDFQKFLGQSVTQYKNDFNPLLTHALARKFSN
jgi:AraC-like DNA-binding protein